MFKTILIANRGEIARRIIKTAKKMGVRTIAIYSQVDAKSPHVLEADSAFCVGEALALESYLNIPAIMKAARLSGAEAIHPGYGFLSENPALPKACQEAGIVFIGPSIAAMQTMGSKQLAKQLLEKTTVPLIPGYHGGAQDDASLLVAAESIGFPVLLKAANGGGGKGMRMVFEKESFQTALDAARREARAYFAEDTMIIEKYIPQPRHIEVQIMADTHGNVVHLFDRDCSIQRRHQKIIEEAPAPNLSPALQTKLTDAAIEAARSIDYVGAGTVEFLVDEKSQALYFMEMNTRLQVEHPVTEMITGIDLVQWQLHIANGSPLPLQQAEIIQKGHAIECRICAEDPANGFIPSVGYINYLQEPLHAGIRIDSGVVLHTPITQYYDPMIAKLISYGVNREEALLRLQEALAHYYIAGVKTNIPFLQTLSQHPDFIAAALSTHFLTEKSIATPAPDYQKACLFAIGYDYLDTLRSATDPIQQSAFGWQLYGQSYWDWHYLLDDEAFLARIYPRDTATFKVCIGDIEASYTVSQNGNQLILSDENASFSCTVYSSNEAITVFSAEGPLLIKRKRFEQGHNNTPEGRLTAPMPSTVVAVLKSPGDMVKTGDSLLVLEAMKMEHTIFAPKDGKILEIFYTKGQQVAEGAELLSLD